MKKDGYILYCDRCGVSLFVETKDGEEIIPENWMKVSGNHLCPKCNDRFQKLLDSFIKRR